MAERLPDNFTEQLNTTLSEVGFIDTAIVNAYNAYNTAFGTLFNTLADCMTDLYTEISEGEYIG